MVPFNSFSETHPSRLRRRLAIRRERVRADDILVVNLVDGWYTGQIGQHQMNQPDKGKVDKGKVERRLVDDPLGRRCAETLVAYFPPS